MIRAPHLRLVDGPLADTQSPRDAIVEKMANDLVRAGNPGNERDAMRTLRDQGYYAADIIMCIDDARQVAMQGVVAREMSEP
jgi:hypothetical protein